MKTYVCGPKGKQLKPIKHRSQHWSSVWWAATMSNLIVGSNGTQYQDPLSPLTKFTSQSGTWQANHQGARQMESVEQDRCTRELQGQRRANAQTYRTWQRLLGVTGWALKHKLPSSHLGVIPAQEHRAQPGHTDRGREMPQIWVAGEYSWKMKLEN